LSSVVIVASLEKEIKQKNFANEQVKANLNVLYTANWIYNKISSFLKPHNLTHEQFNVLRILRGSHTRSMCQKDILCRMIAPNSNVTLIIKKLKAKKLIEVFQSEEDKRAYVITITKDGLSILKKMDKILQEQTVNFNKLGDSEAFHLNALLDKIRS